MRKLIFISALVLTGVVASGSVLANYSYPGRVIITLGGGFGWGGSTQNAAALGPDCFFEPIECECETGQRLLDACALDWSAISPAIFGSLFQSIMDTTARRNLGAHYTSEENILKLIGPLFLDDLRAEIIELRNTIASVGTAQITPLKSIDDRLRKFDTDGLPPGRDDVVLLRAA